MVLAFTAPSTSLKSTDFETIPMKFGDGEQEVSDFGQTITEPELPIALNQPGPILVN